MSTLAQLLGSTIRYCHHHLPRKLTMDLLSSPAWSSVQQNIIKYVFISIWRDCITVQWLTFFSSGIDINVCNKKLFGYMLDMGSEDMTIEDRKIMFTSTIIDYIGEFLVSLILQQLWIRWKVPHHIRIILLKTIVFLIIADYSVLWFFFSLKLTTIHSSAVTMPRTLSLHHRMQDLMKWVNLNSN